MFTKVKFIKEYNYVPENSRWGNSPKKYKVGQEIQATKTGNKITIPPDTKDISGYVKEIYAEYTQTVTDVNGNVKEVVVSNITKTEPKKDEPKDTTKESDNKDNGTDSSVSDEPKKLFGFNRKYVIWGGVAFLVIATGLIVYFGIIKKK